MMNLLDIDRRRVFKATAGLSFLFTTSKATGQTDNLASGSAPSMLDSVTTSLSVLSANPYVKATLAIIDLIGAVQTAKWQSDVTNRLDAIQTKLNEIDHKVNEILAEVQRLPQIIERKLAENTKKELVAAISSKRDTINGILAKYSSYSLSDLKGKIKTSDRLQARSTAQEALELAYQLQLWGADSFFALGEAFAIFQISYNLAGDSVSDPRYVRDRISGAIAKSNALFASAQEGSLSAARTAILNVTDVPNHIFAGSDYPINGAIMNVYGTISGDAGSGFSISTEFKNEKIINARGVTVLGGIPSFARSCNAVFTQRGKFDWQGAALQNFVDLLNAQANAAKVAKDQGIEAGALERSAWALGQVVAAAY